jgi:MFS family permease
MARGFTLYNLRIVLVLTFGSLTFGYSFSVITNTLGQPGFLDYFNLNGHASETNAITGAITGLYCAGATFGALTVGWMSEAKGRKPTMYLGAVVNIVGGALETGSVDTPMFLVSRFITGWGIGMMVVLIPIFQAEICKLPQGIAEADMDLICCSTSKGSRVSRRSARCLDRPWLCLGWLGWRGNILLA